MLPISNPSGIGINELYLVGTEIVKTVDFPTTYVPDAPVPYTVEVVRGQRGTAQSAQADGQKIQRLIEQQNASYIFPTQLPLIAPQLTLQNSLLLLKQVTYSVSIRQIWTLVVNMQKSRLINPADAQSFTINNGDFGSTVLPKTHLKSLRLFLQLVTHKSVVML